jgi:hypothetical protein
MSLHDGVKPTRLLVLIDAHDLTDLVPKLQTPATALLHASVAPRGAAR